LTYIDGRSDDAFDCSVNIKSNENYSPTFKFCEYDDDDIYVDNFGDKYCWSELAHGSDYECEYWWNGDEDVFYGAWEFFNQCPIKIDYIWPPQNYTEEYFDVCDVSPESIDYVQKSFENEPTVHIHTYNDQSDPNYIITDFHLRVDKSKYKIHAGAHGGLNCFVNRKNGEEGMDGWDYNFHFLGL